MKQDKLSSPWTFVGIGLLGIAIGTTIILTQTSVLPVQQKLGAGVTSWIVICAGIVFAGIGTVFALTGFSQTGPGSRIQAKMPALFRVLNFLAATIGLVSLATIVSFAAIAPGARQFVFNIPFVGEYLGRFFFGAIALLLWGVIAIFVWFGVRGVMGKE